MSLLLAGCGAGSEPRLANDTPVVLVSIDTLRADHLPAYGYRAVETPHLDALRRDAVLFRNAWSPCPMTLPSHLTMLTGLLPTEHGVRNNVGFRFRGDSPGSLPGLLKARGFATGAAVSSYVLRAETGLAALFDDYEDSIDPRPGATFAEYQRPGDQTVDLALRWIEARRARPFFFFLHLYEPHVPYQPREPFRARYGDSYDGEIATADDIVGRFFDALRRLGLYERSLIFFTSDHGEGLGDHGEAQHSILLYREAIHVPLLLKLPGSRRGGDSIEVPSQLTDILPTVASLLGVTLPPAAHGLPLLSLRAGTPARAIYAETLYPRLQLGWSELRSLREGRWHYIAGPAPELYDVAQDPAERRDLIAREPAAAERLRTELLARHPLVLPRPDAADAAAAERLAALGYVGALRDPARGGALINPKDGLPMFARLQEAVRLRSQGKLDDSIAALRGLTDEQPGSIEGWTKLGDALSEAERFDEAAAAYEQGRRHAPGPLAELSLAEGYARLHAGKLDFAAEAARAAVAEAPARSHELLARVELARGRLDAASQEARAAAGERPQPSALLLLAEIRTRSGQLEEALALLARAERRAQEVAMSNVFGLDFQRGDVLARLDRIAESEAASRREIQAFPGHLQAWANLGVLLFLQGRVADVDRLMEEMAAANPGRRAPLVAAKMFAALGDVRRVAHWRARAGGPPETKRPRESPPGATSSRGV